MMNTGQLARRTRKQDGYKPDGSVEVNSGETNSAPAAGDPLDLGVDEPLDQGRKIVVEPRLQHGPQHLLHEILDRLRAGLGGRDSLRRAKAPVTEASASLDRRASAACGSAAAAFFRTGAGT